MMSLFAVSDLHIAGPEDPLYFSLIALLRERAKTGDVVILAGDLFDLFVGNKNIFTQRYSSFLEEISSAGRRGIEVHYIEGNHDFLLQGVFRSMKGITLHTRDWTTEIAGKKFYFAHGDTADRTDYGYRALRILFRSVFVRFLVHVLPGRWIDRFGKTSSKLSKESRSVLTSQLSLHRMEQQRTIYRSYAAERLAQGFDFVVLGHCHDLDEMFFTIGGRRGQYINIGYPRIHGSFLTWSPNEEKIHREKLPEMS